MGIKLSPLFKKYYKAIKSCSVSEFSGKVVGVDASIYCYKFCYNHISKTQNSHIDGFFKLITNLYKNNIKVIIVFDGQVPEIKKHTIEKRHEKLMNVISNNANTKCLIEFPPSLFDDIKTLCNYLQIPTLTANYEADMLLKKLYIDKKIDFIISEDMDTLMNGCNLLCKYSYTNNITYIDIQLLLDELNITYDKFIEICLLAGTDYTKTKVKGVGIITAYKKISNNLKLDDIVQNENIEEYLSAKDYILNSYKNEPDINLDTYFNTDLINKDEIKKFLMDKCNYKQSTIDKHINYK